MSTATLEHDLEQFLANTGYKVTFRMGGYLHVAVTYHGQLIADISVMSDWRNYQRGARRARRVIRNHQKAMRMLGGLT